jgi:LPXTG-motif cell wall-anchored protein
MVRLLLILGLVVNLFACASSPEPEAAPPSPPPVTRPAPPPEPEPVYEPPQARELPKTGSSLPALGLSGLAALAGAGALHLVRSRIR